MRAGPSFSTADCRGEANGVHRQTAAAVRSARERDRETPQPASGTSVVDLGGDALRRFRARRHHLESAEPPPSRVEFMPRVERTLELVPGTLQLRSWWPCRPAPRAL